MSLSSFVSKTGVCLLALAFPAALFAQASFRTNSGEYSITGPLPAVQDFPHVSVGPYGGFLVWHDNNLDGDGFGIGAIALDANFSRVLSPFRVNQLRGGDQERPQVALLQGGGAVFVWQGGRQSFQRIYARFLTSSNTWATPDVAVSTLPRYYQIHPSIATLTNGNVVIVWAAFNHHSANSMQDVYGQIFSPAGQKVGSEFLINQYTAFNQRTPAVAALSTGGFVAAWVTEHQRSGPISVPDPDYYHSGSNRPSVQIYARTFDANGTGTLGEFSVNVSSNVCANPSVAAVVDGGFAIAWGHRSMTLADRDWGWDVFARTYSSSGAASPVLPLNGHFYGDQFAPQLRAVGSTYLAIWSSMGQDGSWEGVYGQYLQNGALSGGEFRVNSTVMSRQMHPALGADPSGRMLAAWSSYVGADRTFDLYAQRFASVDYFPVDATPVNYGPPPPEPIVPDPIPPSDPGGGPGGGSNNAGLPVLAFPVASGSSTPPANGLAGVAGTYQGLFYETNCVTAARSGYFVAKLTTKGSFTAKISHAGRSYGVSGSFDAGGHASLDVARPGLTPLSVDLYVDLTGKDQIRGRIAAGTWSSELLADRLVFSKTSPRTPAAGIYTFIIPGDPYDSACPGGSSFATIKVDAGGTVLFASTMADGTKVTQSSAISKRGVWPLYASSYTGKGLLAGWIQFTNQVDCDLTGQVAWIKPAGVNAKYYPSGFTNQVTTMGSFYRAPVSGGRAINLTQGNLVLRGGGLDNPLAQGLTLGVNNRVTTAPGTKLTLTITPSTGLFKGTITDPETGKPMPFQGALFKKADVGVGYFLGTSLSGEVYLSPAP